MENLEEFGKEALKEAVKATKASNSLPVSGDEYEYYASFSGFQFFCSKLGNRLNNIIDKLLMFEDVGVKWPTHDCDVDEQFDALIEANDCLLEQVSSLLDEACSTNKDKDGDSKPKEDQANPTPDVASWNKTDLTKPWKYSVGNIPRPQIKFKDQVDNSPTPFIPMLFSKPNQLRPLPDVYAKLHTPTTLQALIENSKEWATCQERSAHPYLYEIQEFELTSHQIAIKDPIAPGALEDTPLKIITTYDQLRELIDDLSVVTEFAVDLEHHSYRSYQGFVCLMQVSTRTCDYIIDTLELRHCMQEMNVVFTDPSIVKVFHGADWDITWLQRDFAIYVVNLFDTGQASRVLQLPRYSLAFLLDYCCDVQANKQYQLADWRIRPLPQEMIKYARDDTHYLLYIYDRMRNELIRRSSSSVDNNLLVSVMNRSRDIAMKVYQKPILNEDDHLKLCHKFKRTLNHRQAYCLKLLYKWRDQIARQEDESSGYVLPNHMLFQISETLPREPQGILACCNPVPVLLRQHVQEVYSIIEKTKTQEDTSVVTTHIITEETSDEMEYTVTDHTDDAQRHHGIDVYNITMRASTACESSIMKSKDKQIPSAVNMFYDGLQKKFQEIIGQYLPATYNTPPSASRVVFNSNIEHKQVSNSDSSITPAKRPKHPPQPINTTPQPQKKARIEDNEQMDTSSSSVSGFQYKPKGFTKTVQGTHSNKSKDEYYPQEAKIKKGPRRSSVKTKSSKTFTINNNKH